MHILSKYEFGRAVCLARICMTIQDLRESGATLHQAIQRVRKRSNRLYFKKGTLSEGALKTHYYRWEKTRLVNVLIRQFKPNEPEIPLALLEEFLNRINADQVVSASVVISTLRADWKMGKALPGLGTWNQYLRLRHGVTALPSMPPRFPFSKSTFYRYLSRCGGSKYQQRITKALRAQQELERFTDFIESQRDFISAARLKEPLG